MNCFRHAPCGLLMLVAALLFALPHHSATSEEPDQGAEISSVVQVADDDPEIKAAMAKARETVDEFVKALQDPKPSQSGFAIKMPVRDGEEVEHMWLNRVRLKDGKFIGRVNNEPQTVKNVKFGDELQVAKDKISDWLYKDGADLKGAYTTRVLMRRMAAKQKGEDEVPPADRGELDKELLGRWKMLTIDRGIGPERRPGYVLTVSEKDLVFVGPDGGTRRMGWIHKIDASREPRQLDLRKGEHLGLGIYEVQGDTLKLLVHNPDRPRPKEFKGSENGMLFTLERLESPAAEESSNSQ